MNYGFFLTLPNHTRVTLILGCGNRWCTYTSRFWESLLTWHSFIGSDQGKKLCHLPSLDGLISSNRIRSRSVCRVNNMMVIIIYMGFHFKIRRFFFKFLKVHLTKINKINLGSRPMFNPNQVFLLVQKLKLDLRVFYTRSLEKLFSICPKLLLINAEL
jgi:hypothetical protein